MTQIMNNRICIFYAKIVQVAAALFLANGLLAQNMDIKIYDKQMSDEGITIYADNNEHFPVSIELKLELKGLETTHGQGDILVLQPRMKEQPLTTLRPIPGKSWSYRSSVRSFFGDVLISQYDTSHVYELPIARGTSEYISQGYFGKISHHQEYALDFDLAEGTPVYAVRAGTVVKVVDNFNKSCPDASCMQYNNFMIISHNDGTYADYAHLKKNGALAELGDEVAVGDLIANSGNTGWTTGPHLHLVIFVPAVNKRKTIPTLFKIGATQSEELREGNSYIRY